jgi:small-conductance mechanosensitive channel
VLAVVLVAAFYGIGKGVRALVRRNAQRRGEQRTLELAIGRLAQAAILLVGVLVAVTAAFPSFTPADLISTLGIGGVAIGFAFKDIFQNFLAGILILVTRPFGVGDQIRFKDYEGTVEDIQTRATYLKTYDGRRVIIPNGELYTNSVTVNTAFPQRRWQYDIGSATATTSRRRAGSSRTCSTAPTTSRPTPRPTSSSWTSPSRR